MDDADLAGPFVFCFAFAFFLLLVSRHPRHFAILFNSCSHNRYIYVVWETPILIHLRRRSPRHHRHLPLAQPHVRNRYRRLPHSLRPRLLPLTHGRPRRYRHGCRYRSAPGLPPLHHQYRLVHTRRQCDLRRCPANGSPAATGSVPDWIVVWLFCTVEYF